MASQSGFSYEFTLEGLDHWPEMAAGNGLALLSLLLKQTLH